MTTLDTDRQIDLAHLMAQVQDLPRLRGLRLYWETGSDAFGAPLLSARIPLVGATGEQFLRDFANAVGFGADLPHHVDYSDPARVTCWIRDDHTWIGLWSPVTAPVVVAP